MRQLTLGGLGGLMLLTTSGVTPNTSDNSHPLYAQNSNNMDSQVNISKEEDKGIILRESLSDLVPSEVRKLTPEEENKIASVLSDKLKMTIKPELEGIRLNRSYGLIGAEQHLYRYPGDTVQKHADNAVDWAMYGGSGIAPGLGAWGYFVPSESQFSQKDKQRERYYLAIQTFLAPGFSENFARYRDFFRFRKMVVVNPNTGQAVVAVVGDAGPAEWTGKHLGGSPEVMHYLSYGGGPRKGPVFYFFVDDPDDKIPLGPVR